MRVAVPGDHFAVDHAAHAAHRIVDAAQSDGLQEVHPLRIALPHGPLDLGLEAGAQVEGQVSVLKCAKLRGGRLEVVRALAGRGEAADLRPLAADGSRSLLEGVEGGGHAQRLGARPAGRRRLVVPGVPAGGEREGDEHG